MRMTAIFLTIVILFGGAANAADPIKSDDVFAAMQADKISLQDSRKWYMVYKGAYLYVKDFECEGSNNFNDVFSKIRKIRDKIVPTKGNTEFVKASSLDAYKELEFTQDNKTDLAEDLFQIAEGIKKNIEALE